MFKIINFILAFSLLINGSVAQSLKDITLLFEGGENQLNQGQYADAIQSFTKVIVLKVDYTDAYYYRAAAREKMNDREGALIDYTIALEWKHDFAEALLKRGELLYKMQRYDSAQRDFEKFLTIPLGETHDILYRKSAYEGVNRIVTAQGATDIIYNYLGLIAIQHQRYESAITWFDKAINLYNSEPDYYVNRGVANEKLLLYDAAKADYEMALKKSEDHGLAQQHLATLARTQGNREASDRYLSEAIDRNPHLPYAYLERAYHRGEAGDYHGAIDDYTAALKIDSLAAEVWVNRGLAFEKLNQLTAAYTDFTQAIKINERVENAWLCRANILVKQNKLTEAIEDYSVALYYDSKYALAYYNRALIRYRIGEHSLACEDLMHAEGLGQPISQKVKSKICADETY